jgi:tetratricopeptide (TPR) repeat protein
MELEPMYFTILKTGDRVEIKNYDANELFKKAEELFAAGRMAQAKKTYLMVANEAIEPEVAGLAWFDVALCELALDKPGAALQALTRAAPLIKDLETLNHITLLTMESHARSGDWKQVKELGDALQNTDLPAHWSARAHLLQGRSEYQASDLAEADRHFKAAINRILSSKSLKEQYGDGPLSEAWFRRGLVQRQLFKQIKFALPVGRMTLDMTDKLALMRQAEELFLNAVRNRNETWSPQAGYEVANLYHTFALDLMQAEVPASFNELERRIYVQELNAKVLPFLRRAQAIHNNNTSMCETYRFSSKWNKKSRRKATEVKDLMEELARSLPEIE